MADAQPQFLTAGSGLEARRIAYLQQPATTAGRPGVIWLCGLKSEMTSTKASALAEWAAAQGLACTRFDYSGHGQSEGRFDDGTVTRWLAETRAVFETLTQGPQVLVGSSMGGYMALLLLRELLADAPSQAARVKALALIAPAWDMTELMWSSLPAARPQGHRGEGRLSAPVALRGWPLPDHARLPRGRPQPPDRH